MTVQQQNWFALDVEVASEASEAIEFGFNELGASGTEINNLGIRPQETMHVIGYFEEMPDEKAVESELTEALRIYDFSPAAIRARRWRKIGNVDWLYEWKKHWKATETDRFIIAPTWEKVEDSDKIVIYIEPSMAFGTGTHNTTQLCLKAIEDDFTPEMSFLDVGTGTGILIIGAAKITAGIPDSKFQIPNSGEEISNSGFQIPNSENQDSASDSSAGETNLESGIWNLESNPNLQSNPNLESINRKSQIANRKSFVGCDTDEGSIKIAVENAALNETENIEFYVGSISDATPVYDFVCANLTIDVITPLLDLLIEKSGKILVLSGILKEQENQIVAELERRGIENQHIETSGEWISVKIDK